MLSYAQSKATVTEIFLISQTHRKKNRFGRFCPVLLKLLAFYLSSQPKFPRKKTLTNVFLIRILLATLLCGFLLPERHLLFSLILKLVSDFPTYYFFQCGSTVLKTVSLKYFNWISATRFAELLHFGKIRNIGDLELSEEKLYSVSLDKDFIFNFAYILPLVLLSISPFNEHYFQLVR